MQVGEDPQGNILYQVVVHVEGVDIVQLAYRLPGNVDQVVVREVQILEGPLEVLKRSRRDVMELIVAEDQVPEVGQAT